MSVDFSIINQRIISSWVSDFTVAVKNVTLSGNGYNHTLFCGTSGLFRSVITISAKATCLTGLQNHLNNIMQLLLPALVQLIHTTAAECRGNVDTL